jgi:hypothetical protein
MLFTGNPGGKGRQRTPGKRWLEEVENDLMYVEGRDGG